MTSWYKKSHNGETHPRPALPMGGRGPVDIEKTIYEPEPLPLAPTLFDMDITRKPKIEDTEEYQKLKARAPHLLRELMKNCNSYKEIENALKTYRFKYVRDGIKVIVTIDDKQFLIENFNNPTVKSL